MTDLSDAAIEELVVPTAKRGKRLQGLLRDLRAADYDKTDQRQFLAFAMSRARDAKGQLFQDLWALWVSDQKRGGFFVEAGAASGVRLSNTYYLEKKMEWTGILAEPHPAFSQSLADNRTAIISSKCLYSESGQEISFLASHKGEFSRIADIVPVDAHEERRARSASLITVDTITLNDLLEQHAAPRQIDYLSLDTEGSEFEILSAFDFGRWDVRALTVEHNYTPAREEIFKLLTANGYIRQWTDISLIDDWYVRA